MLKSDLRDYIDALKGRITIEGTNPINRRNKKLTFKTIAPFRLCMSKFNNILIENVEDRDIVMTMLSI